MGYSDFTPDPSLWKLDQNFKALCSDGEIKKKYLSLWEQCFVIYDDAKDVAEFCALKTWKYPVDSYEILDIEIASGETKTLFDNDLIGLIGNLDDKKAYVRGVIFKLCYPDTKPNGDKVEISDMNCFMTETDPLAESLTTNICDVFSKFTNPAQTLPAYILNKIAINNPNTFDVKLRGLLIRAKTLAPSGGTRCSPY
jgi:hypothetical protein